MKALTDYIHAKGLKAGHLHLARAADLRGLRRQLPARGAGRPAVRRLGLRFPEVRLVLLRQRGQDGNGPRRDEEALPADGRPPARSRTATSSSTSASTAWATCGSGAREVGGHCWRTGRRPGLRARTASSRSRCENAEHRAVRKPGALERSRLHPDRLHRQRARHGRAAALPADAQRAVRLHVAVVPDGRAACSTAAT